MYCVLVSSIDIRVCSRYCHFDFVLVFAGLDDTEIRRNLVVTLRAPRNVANLMEDNDKLFSAAQQCYDWATH